MLCVTVSYEMSSRHKILKKKEVLVIAHDAGGAEIIAAYLRAHAPRFLFRSYIAGPACRIFRREGIPFKHAPSSRSGLERIIKKHAHVAYALLGTGWMTGLETTALSQAKRLDVKTCVYLDSWKNYRERFGFPAVGWQMNLPDEIWVGDTKAYTLAKRYFDCRIRFVKNQYFADIGRRFKTLQKKALKDLILFVSAPVAESEGILADLLENLTMEETSPTVRIRRHPADNPRRYNALIKRYQKHLHVEMSREKDILQDLTRARAVVGFETTALAVAAMLGVGSITVMHSNREVVLPFFRMLRVNNAKEALRRIKDIGSHRKDSFSIGK